MAKKSKKVSPKVVTGTRKHTHAEVSAASLFLVLCFLAVVTVLAIQTVNGN